jgi:hypothetical protein
MRYFKKTFLWIILLSILGGYLYIYEIRGGKEREQAEEEASRLFRFTPEDVIELELKKPGSLIHLIRDEKGWQMDSPVKAKADDKSVHSVLQYITETKNDSKYVMEENPSPQRLVEFGLSNPSLQVEIRVKGEPAKTIYFGDRGPTQNVAYAMVKGDPRVYRVVADARAEADRDDYYFRDKTIASFKPFEADKLEISINGQTMRAELPMMGKWEITQPLKARADLVKIMELLSKLSEGEIKAFIDEEPKDLGLYGLNPPRAEVSVWGGGDNKGVTTLLFGDKDIKKRGVYVKHKDSPNVFLLEEDVWDILPRDVSHLRDQSVFFFEEEKVTKIQLKSPIKETLWEKDSHAEWKQKMPVNSSVEFSIIKDLLEKLKGVRIKEFVVDNPKDLKEFGLNKPAYTIKIWQEGSNTPQELNIGKTDNSGRAVYALTEGNSIVSLGMEITELFKTL